VFTTQLRYLNNQPQLQETSIDIKPTMKLQLSGEICRMLKMLNHRLVKMLFGMVK